MAAETCDKCGEQFLSEADPYLVSPENTGVKLYCFACAKEICYKKYNSFSLGDIKFNIEDLVLNDYISLRPVLSSKLGAREFGSPRIGEVKAIKRCTREITLVIPEA